MRVAALTQVRDEQPLLPTWLKYYSKHFDNIYVSNHAGATDYIDELEGKYKFGRFSKPGDGTMNHELLVSTVKECYAELLKEYDYVLYADADEFVIPRHGTLREYIQKVTKPQIICQGREVLTLDDEEKIDWDKPLLRQRTKWWHHIAEYKIPIGNYELNWVNGFHYIKEMVKAAEINDLDLTNYILSQAEDDIYMVHISKIDWDLFCSRGRFKGNKGIFKKGVEDKTFEDIPEWIKDKL